MRITQALISSHQKVQIIPYLTLGILPAQYTLALVEFLVRQGVQVIEFGLPFSDPVADGPIIQAASHMALKNTTTLAERFTLIRQVRQQHPTLGICLMLYANSAYSVGLEKFYRLAKQAGVDSLLIPDVPNIESTEFLSQAKNVHIQQILFATPHCSAHDLKYVAEHSNGFVYCITRQGVTGERATALGQMQHTLQTLKTFKSAPLVCGFGIQTYHDLETVNQLGCHGAVIGSRLMSHLVQEQLPIEKRIESLKHDFITNILAEYVSPLPAET